MFVIFKNKKQFFFLKYSIPMELFSLAAPCAAYPGCQPLFHTGWLLTIVADSLIAEGRTMWRFTNETVFKFSFYLSTSIAVYPLPFIIICLCPVGLFDILLCSTWAVKVK